MLTMKPGKGDAIAEILKALLAVAVCGLLAWVLTGCLGDDNEPVEEEKVLLVYLGGDNNLSGESADKLDAIAQGYHPAAGRRVLIYRDSRDESPCLMELEERGQLKTIENYDAENSADPKVFSRVILKAKSMYPGASFNLVVFSHATGWLPQGGYSNPQSASALRSVLMDGTDEMELSDFAGAIPDLCFNYIVFEACHMAGIEVAWELKNKAAYIAASSAEIVSPGFTNTYSGHLNLLLEGDPTAFMRQAFDYFDSQTDYLHSATFSVVKTDRLEALAGYVKGHCDFSKEVDINTIQCFDRGSYRLLCDFGDYYSRLLSTPQEQQELKELIEKCVVWKAATPYFMQGYNGFAINTHAGITAYIMRQGYHGLNTAYKELSWYKAINKQ